MCIILHINKQDNILDCVKSQSIRIIYIVSYVYLVDEDVQHLLSLIMFDIFASLG